MPSPLPKYTEPFTTAGDEVNRSQASGMVWAADGYPCRFFASNFLSNSVANTQRGLPVSRSIAARAPVDDTK